MTEEVKKEDTFIKRLRAKNDRIWANFYGPKTKISTMGKWYTIFPAVIILIGIILLCIPNIGFNLGLDFTGGSVIEAAGISRSSEVTEAKNSVESYLKGEGIKYETSTPVSTGGSRGLSVKYQIKNGADMEAIADGIISRIEDAAPGAEIKESESISAAASNERLVLTFISIAVAMIAIMIYMLFRFKLTSGIAAVVALLHDVLVMCAMCIICRIQINYSFVAAVITIVVYSLNNTIVQFDRIRAKEKMLKNTGTKMPVEQLVDTSVKEVFARTISTTITTLVPVVVLCCLPVPLIRDFALPIMFGLIAGTFSTLFTTTSLYVRFERYRNKRSNKHNENKKPMQSLVDPA